MNQVAPFNFKVININRRKKGVTIRDEIMQNNNVY
ncbi:hypothetical protein IMAU80007_02041 [Lactiplantibacillus plantarum]|nr:hypothetical protein [Lactiplantibacillus plantarum]MCG0941468.1 hypothetical protein [Lactiplantibacillus plantarum]QHM44805.1 hypothetical protein C7M38_02974 [Lactiplantibacillus plantarum]QHM49032.1 hypothetical protein C7M40_00960 [Lactiplantibacillus plantarum]